MPWDKAIQTVLAEKDGIMRYTDIADRIRDLGLRHSLGATPATTVAVYLGASLKEQNSPYVRHGGGLYSLKATQQPKSRAVSEDLSDHAETLETGALRAFGMFWQRGNVLWTGAPTLLGSQGVGAKDVNFASQVGVYLLHDRERVIYVGRAGDTLFARLKAHTADRMSGRWDRFSWFGLRKVDEAGALSDVATPWSQEVVIETMEALLIESLEPPQNRRRGDNFSASEYSQTPDPRIESLRKRALWEEMKEKL
jgi:hypothetical protein